MSNILGRSEVDGNLGDADLTTVSAPNGRIIEIVSNGVLSSFETSDTQAVGGIALASGNFANPLSTGSPSSGEANTSSNSGAGAGLALPKSGVDLPFKSIVAGTNVSITEQAETITISSSGSGEANTSSNLGGGEGLATPKSGVNLPFKSLVAGAGVSLTSDADTVTISSTGAGTGDMLKSTYDPTNISSDCFARSNHTGTQAISTITNLQTELDTKLTESDAGYESTVANDAIYNTQTGVNYTLLPTDRGKTVRMNNATSNTVSIDTNANQAIPVNSVVIIGQLGAGATTIQAVAGVSLNGVDGGSAIITGQFKSAVLDQYAVNEWWCEGAI